MALAQEKCVACRRDSPKVTDDEMAELQPMIPQWQLTESDGIRRLKRGYKFRNFADAMAFTAKIGEAAEAEGHHPRLTLEWGRVGVEWWSHKIRGLHRNDFIMSSKTDEIYGSFSDAT